MTLFVTAVRIGGTTGGVLRACAPSCLAGDLRMSGLSGSEPPTDSSMKSLYEAAGELGSARAGVRTGSRDALAFDGLLSASIDSSMISLTECLCASSASSESLRSKVLTLPIAAETLPKLPPSPWKLDRIVQHLSSDRESSRDRTLARLSVGMRPWMKAVN